MDNKIFTKLVGDLHEDADLFHAFIFEPAKALKRLSYLDDSTKKMLLCIAPQSFIADAAGLLEKETLQVCGPATTVSGPCGGVTCGGFTCDVTCTESSCGNTCGNSCGYTTNFTDRFREAMHGESSFARDGRGWDDAYIAWE